MQFGEPAQKEAAEQGREHLHRYEEVAAARNPAIAFWRESAAGYDAMDMRMMIELLSPGVQDGDDADVGTEVLWIGSDRGQRLGHGRKQQAVDLRAPRKIAPGQRLANQIR